MTIKKPMKAPVAEPVADIPEMPAAAAAPGAPAAATIADRFKLDLPDPNAKAKKSGGLGATIAVVAALLALAVSGGLVFLLYQHWEFLQGA